jgi:enoyl-CoA hydratase
MIAAIDRQLETWAGMPEIRAIVFKGAGEKAFSAGGDIKTIHAAMIGGDWGFLEQFYRKEYSLNYRIATYGKPVIAVMRGLVMGGGAGIAMHCSHRVVTGPTEFAMPECRIGFFPDVGAGFFLRRCPGAIGMAIGLGALSLRGPGLMRAGLATHFVPMPRLGEVSLDLLEELARPIESAGVDEVKADIDAIFSLPSLDEIITVLRLRRDAWAKGVYQALSAYSPTSLKLTFAHLARARSQSLAEVLTTEFRMSQHFVRAHDFGEGIRAQVIDKDFKPIWRPARLDEITTEIDSYFQPVPGMADWSPVQ